MLNDSIIAIIARMHPELWEIIGGGPAGPGGPGRVASGPRPEPWTTERQVFRAGFEQGERHVDAFVTADLLRADIDPDGPLCGFPPGLVIPVPQGGGDPTPHPNWEAIFAAGWATAVSARAYVTEGLRGADTVAKQLEIANEIAAAPARSAAFANHEAAFAS